MKKILIFCSLLCFLSIPYQTQAAVSSQKIAKVYSNFSQKLDAKYSLVKQIQTLEELRDALTIILERKLSSDKAFIVSELNKYNNNYLFSLYTEQEKDNTSQKKLELQQRLQLKNSLSVSSHPDYIKILLSKGKQLYSTNNAYDFIDGNAIKKIRFSRFFSIVQGGEKQFFNKNGIIIFTPDSGEYKFVETYYFEEKIPYSQLEEKFNVFITPKSNYFLEDGTYYGYTFSSFSFLEDTYGVFLEDLEKLSLDTTNTLLYKNKDLRYNFITHYKKKKLVAKDILDGVVDQQKILEYIRDDKRELVYETDTLLQEIKQKSISLTSGKNQDEKIAIIYDWILNHVTYTTDIDLEDEKIFSGIDTYKNKNGVCTGYSKLISYMLIFAGISGTDIILGDVIDAQDFPQIGHAWVRIGDNYYDPTFDDPIGAKDNKTPEEYKYFNLPQDLFYTNRFNKGETPAVYKSLSLTKRKDLVSKRLYNVADKYKSYNYNVLTPVIFKKENNLSYNEKITPEVLGKIIPIHNVQNNNFSFLENGKLKKITALKYYIIDDTTTESALENINYDISDSYLFLWERDNGEYEYRLTYDISLR